MCTVWENPCNPSNSKPLNANRLNSGMQSRHPRRATNTLMPYDIIGRASPNASNNTATAIATGAAANAGTATAAATTTNA